MITSGLVGAKEALVFFGFSPRGRAAQRRIARNLVSLVAMDGACLPVQHPFAKHERELPSHAC